MVAQGAEPMLFDFLPQAAVVVQRHHGQLTSDAGLLPLRQFDQRWKFTGRMVQCLDDPHPDRPHLSARSRCSIGGRRRFVGLKCGGVWRALPAHGGLLAREVNGETAKDQCCVRRERLLIKPRYFLR